MPIPRHQPIADKRADQANYQIADQSETATLHQPAGEPSRDNADDQDDKKTLIGQMHGRPPSKNIKKIILTHGSHTDNAGTLAAQGPQLIHCRKFRFPQVRADRAALDPVSRSARSQ